MPILLDDVGQKSVSLPEIPKWILCQPEVHLKGHLPDAQQVIAKKIFFSNKKKQKLCSNKNCDCDTKCRIC